MKLDICNHNLVDSDEFNEVKESFLDKFDRLQDGELRCCGNNKILVQRLLKCTKCNIIKPEDEIYTYCNICKTLEWYGLIGD